MDNIIKQTDQQNKSAQPMEGINEVEITEKGGFSDIAKKSTRMALEQMEMVVMKHGQKGGLDISIFSEQQKDKILDLMHKNEDNGFRYLKDKLDVTERLNTKAIEASIVNQRTLRYCLIVGLVSLVVILLLILFFKETYFIPFLSFVAGLAGGLGIKEPLSNLMKRPELIKDEESKV